MKRQCVAIPSISVDSFDLKIRPLYGQHKEPIPICIEIVPKLQSQTKDYVVSLIILADVSGSMLDGCKTRNLRDGIMRIGDLANRFVAPRIELTIIEFNQEARIVLPCTTTPTAKQLRKVCNSLSPEGGTNIGAALNMALSIALGKKVVHIVLFTDGEDGCNLKQKLEAKHEPYIKNLGVLPNIWLHCVGICADVDAQLLDSLRRLVRRGTFQTISDNDIAKLVGVLWGLMMEVVDPNCVVSLTVDDRLQHSQEAILRIPSSGCRVLAPNVPPGTLKAALVIDGSTKEQIFTPENESGIDEVCALEVVDQCKADTFSALAAALADYDFDAVESIHDKAIRSLETMFRETTPRLSEYIEAALRELNDHKGEIMQNRESGDLVREASMSALSRASTVRSNGLSLDPSSRTLSELQSQLLE